MQCSLTRRVNSEASQSCLYICCWIDHRRNIEESEQELKIIVLNLIDIINIKIKWIPTVDCSNDSIYENFKCARNSPSGKNTLNKYIFKILYRPRNKTYKNKSG